MLSLLDVFISSDLYEFRKERIKISSMIGKMPFLKCAPLETRGASHHGVREASLQAARQCDIYIGLNTDNCIHNWKLPPPICMITQYGLMQMDNMIYRSSTRRLR